MAEKTTNLATTLTALRGIVMIVAGGFAIASPTDAVRFVVLVGGGILLIDGILNLASLNTGGRDFPFWIGLLRSVSAIAAGLLIVFSPWLLSIMTIDVLRWLIGLQAIAVGVIEMLSPVLARGTSAPRRSDRSLWGYVVSGGAYALFGLAIIVVPLSAAALLARVVAVLMIVYAISLFVRSWRQRSSDGLR
ncbi:DUF308 domain-containing protein [Pelagibacterium mangrovi]|uniref:DUF308 domain-containing protein n=1 Tax=Pelagibacterium mangrovi TaxID=3119828 RepID=UPI002FC70D7F